VSITVAAQSSPVGTTNANLSTAAPITAIPMNTLGANVTAGEVVITDPTYTYTQTYTTTGATMGTGSIPVSAETPNYNYPTGSMITLPSSYTLPANTQMTLTLSGATVGFQTITQLVFPQGTTTQQTTVAALISGQAANGAGAPAQMVDQIDWVTGVSVVTTASNGSDQQDDDQYMNDLASTLQLLAPRPITASDYATMALNFTPAVGTDQEQVGRASSIDGYDPPTDTYFNEREVSVCVTDSNGNPLNYDTMYGVGGSPTDIITTPSTWGIAGWLESLREASFIVNVVGPNYTGIYVAVTVVAVPGWAASTVQANVQTALLGYLNPTSFALPVGASSGWANQTTIYFSQVLAVIQSALGVQYVPAGQLFVDINPNPTNATDLVLGGPFPLPISTTSTIQLSNINVIIP
jgi:hypothetical protein